MTPFCAEAYVGEGGAAHAGEKHNTQGGRERKRHSRFTGYALSDGLLLRAAHLRRFFVVAWAHISPLWLMYLAQIMHHGGFLRRCVGKAHLVGYMDGKGGKEPTGGKDGGPKMLVVRV